MKLPTTLSCSRPNVLTNFQPLFLLRDWIRSRSTRLALSLLGLQVIAHEDSKGRFLFGAQTDRQEDAEAMVVVVEHAVILLSVPDVLG